MKNQYFGDINDYRKYGLLRALCRGDTRLSVCWMLTPDDSGPDGKKTKYLEQPTRWRGFDCELFELLKQAVPHNRRVCWAEEIGILRSACFFSRLLNDNKDQREQYFRDFSRCANSRDLVFFDPDNGLQVPSRCYGKRGSSKYLYWKELEDTWAAGRSILLYQHFRREKRDDFITRVAADLQAKIPGAHVVAFRTPHVVLFLLAQPEHSRLVSRAGEVERVWARQIRVTFHPPRKEPEK